jgi:hypothetical protein
METEEVELKKEHFQIHPVWYVCEVVRRIAVKTIKSPEILTLERLLEELNKDNRLSECFIDGVLSIAVNRLIKDNKIQIQISPSIKGPRRIVFIPVLPHVLVPYQLFEITPPQNWLDVEV